MSGGSHHGSHKMGHTQSTKVYLTVLAVLFVLTVVTVAVSTKDFGRLNDVIAIGIASIKASLVILFFMHGRFESKLTWAFVYYPIVLLGILVGALFLDYGFRHKEDFKDWDKLKSATLTLGEHGSGDHGSGDQGATAAHDTAASPDAAADHTHADGETHAAHEEPAPATPAWTGVAGDAAAGKAKAQTTCIACHVVDGAGNALPTAPAFEVSANAAHIDPVYLRKYLKNPPEVKPGTIMPNLGLSDTEIENLIAFLQTYKK